MVSAEFGRGSERIDVAAAARQPAVQAIAERGSVRHRDVERAGGLQDASDFGERAGEIVEMFEAVVGNYGVEGVVGKGKAGGVGLREVQRGMGGAVEIGADGDEWADIGGEAARARSEIEHALAGPQVPQDFVHVYFYQETRGRRWLISKSKMINEKAYHKVCMARCRVGFPWP